MLDMSDICLEELQKEKLGDPWLENPAPGSCKGLRHAKLCPRLLGPKPIC